MLKTSGSVRQECWGGLGIVHWCACKIDLGARLCRGQLFFGVPVLYILENIVYRIFE